MPWTTLISKPRPTLLAQRLPRGDTYPDSETPALHSRISSRPTGSSRAKTSTGSWMPTPLTEIRSTCRGHSSCSATAPYGQSSKRRYARQGTEGVTFCGFRQIEDLPAYYAFAGAFLHPALVDQWALVVNEAMASSLPIVVSTGAGCHVDLVDQGKNGFRFAPDDVRALTEAMHIVAAPETNRAAMGRRSREIVEGWSPEAFARSMWSAVQAGHARADRRPNVGVQVLIELLNRLPGSIKAFHTVEA